MYIPVCEGDPVISAVRQVVLTSDQEVLDCQQLFAQNTSAHNFSMSEDFQTNIGEFLSAVNASLARATDLEGNSFQMETGYRFLHFLARKLEFVHTVCETGRPLDRHSTLGRPYRMFE